MSKFAYPEWRLPPGYYDPPPPPDPETRRDLDTQVEDALNGFIEARLKVLHTEPDAYFRKRGREAVEGVGAITDRLEGLKAETIAGAGTDYERRALDERTSGMIGLDQGDIRRHVGRELKEWLRQAMTRRIELLRTQAGLDWKDRDALQSYASAAESAAQGHGAADGLAPDSEEMQGRVRAARSGVLRSAVEGALNGNHLAEAIALHEQIRDHLAPDDAQAVGPQIDYARELQTGHGYVAPFLEALPDRVDEIGVAHRAALERNAVDWPDNPGQHATNAYLLNRAFGEQRWKVAQRRAELEKQIADWFDQRQPGDSPWPPHRLWVQLDPDRRQQVYERLKFKSDSAVVVPEWEAIDEQSENAPTADEPQTTDLERDPTLILAAAGDPPQEDERIRRWQRRAGPQREIEKVGPKEILPPLGPPGGGARLPSSSKGPSAAPPPGVRPGSGQPSKPVDAIGIGKYAGESIPARSPKRDFTDDERAEMNRIGADTGCHTCGTKDPGIPSGNFVPDHQPPSRLAKPGQVQRLYPQCLDCSHSQGGLITQELRREKE